MVILQVKRGDDNQFLYEADVRSGVGEVVADVAAIFNGRLKVARICCELEELGKHGTFLPTEMQGLNEDQIKELKLEDPWAQRCAPAGWRFEKDPMGRRCGRAPPPELQEVLKRAADTAKGLVSKKLVDAGRCLTQKDVSRALEELRGASKIVFPGGLPPHDPVRQELDNTEDLSGMQAALEVIDPTRWTQKDVSRALEELGGAIKIAFPGGLPPHRVVRRQTAVRVGWACLWACGKQLLAGNRLSDHLGTNNKSKVVAKLCSSKEGAPGREPAISEEDRKQLMLHAYRKQEEWKKLEQDEDDRYLNASWADGQSMKRQFHGLGDGVSWRPRLK